MPYTSALLPAVTGIKDLSVFTSNLYYFGFFFPQIFLNVVLVAVIT